MSSPALDPGTGAVQKLLLAVVAPLLPNLAVNNGLKVDWISRDAGRRQGLRRRPAGA